MGPRNWKTKQPQRQSLANDAESNNTKSENLEGNFAEILERAHQLEWNEMAKNNLGFGPRKKIMRVLEFDQADFEIKLADGKCRGPNS